METNKNQNKCLKQSHAASTWQTVTEADVWFKKCGSGQIPAPMPFGVSRKQLFMYTCSLDHCMGGSDHSGADHFSDSSIFIRLRMSDNCCDASCSYSTLNQLSTFAGTAACYTIHDQVNQFNKTIARCNLHIRPHIVNQNRPCASSVTKPQNAKRKLIQKNGK
jgi:hypothetical protein